jgi:hypothetical protein
MSPHFDLLTSSSFCFVLFCFFFFFSQSFDFVALANHPQGDLATFGYKLGINLLKSFHILATCVQQCVDTR